MISFFALVVAGFSFFVASERFRLDIYNKRFDIYMRTVKFYLPPAPLDSTAVFCLRLSASVSLTSDAVEGVPAAELLLGMGS